MKGKRTPPEVRQRILDMAAAGKRYKEIVAKTGVCELTAHRIVKGQPPRTRERKANYVPEELWREWDEVTKRLRGGRS